eukprot:7610721-Pyramimonas_sp.AAC.1
MRQRHNRWVNKVVDDLPPDILRQFYIATNPPGTDAVNPTPPRDPQGGPAWARKCAIRSQERPTDSTNDARRGEVAGRVFQTEAGKRD